MPLIGRDSERRAITGVLDSIRNGFSASLVLRGEAGIGKTALLNEAAAACNPPRVVHLIAIESEMELGFAALHQLLYPFLGRLHDLPGPQREALLSAFGLTDSQPADRFLLGLATLSLLADVASDEGLLVIIDDAQWLDRESADAIGFAARRLDADPIGFLFALRDPNPRSVRFDGLEELDLGGLAPADARRVLAANTTHRVDDPTLDRILDECRGNPLALVEVAAELVPGRIAGGSLVLEPVPLSGQLEARFLETVAALPPATQTLLLIGAADPTGQPSRLWQACDLLDVPRGAAGPAEEVGLLTIGSVVTFRHPLIRSAVYHGSSASARRLIHSVLATVTDQVKDADRYAWHRASSVIDVDGDVADELEAAAGRAKARGGYAATAAFLTRAADLTPDSPIRIRRLLSAAEATVTAGEPEAARYHLELIKGQLHEPLDRARTELVHAMVLYASGQDSAATFLGAAREFLTGGDAHAARSVLLEALVASFVNGQFASPPGSMDAVVGAIHATPLPPGETPTVGDQLLDGFAAMHDGEPATAAALLLPAVDRLLDEGVPIEDTLAWLFYAGNALGALGDVERLHELSTKLVRVARANGAAVTLTRALHHLVVADVIMGSLDAAISGALSGRGLVSGQDDVVDLGAIMVAAWRGQEDEVRREATAGFSYAQEHRQGWMLVYLHYAMEVLELGLRNYQAAMEHASALVGQRLNIVSFVAIPDFVEAAVRSGEPTAAADMIERWAPYAMACDTPFGRGLLAQCHALVGDDPDQYQRAIDQLEQTLAVGAKARAHQLYGEWLRRQKKKSAARTHLLRSVELFDQIGADGFAARSQVELRATGTTARKRSVDTVGDLTPQEAEIASLASERLSNREIGSQLFISAATVEYHLRKIYRKLDIGSRVQLKEALQGDCRGFQGKVSDLPE